MLVTAKRRPKTRARMSPAARQEFRWTGSTVLGLPSVSVRKEASIIRPFKGCVARKFSCSRESSGPHREPERVWSCFALSLTVWLNTVQMTPWAQGGVVRDPS